VLSYLVPGLGQISQGRVGKGALFFVCVYALFFYGTLLGSGTARADGKEYRISSPVYLPDTATSDRNNPLGLPIFLANLYNRPQYIAQFWAGIAAWPAIYQYRNFHDEDPDPPLSGYQRAPDPKTNNAVHTNVGRNIELGWVFTVIAGVLNILVIYDALAGPAFLAPLGPTTKAT
jgi:hypothetical protein